MATLRNYLRRYTDLPSLLHLLRTQQITLLDPQNWDDKNDSYFLKLYKEKFGLRSVLVLCFTRTSEKYHHWRVFANGASGICISFRRESLLRAVRKIGKIRTGEVRYLKLDEIEKMKLKARDLPFLKRYPFEHEEEFRIVFESSRRLASLDIPVPLSCIDRITLSPWLHLALAAEVKKVIWGIEGCEDLRVHRSTLISNAEWQSFGESATHRN
jgi:hypothetical protein